MNSGAQGSLFTCTNSSALPELMKLFSITVCVRDGKKTNKLEISVFLGVGQVFARHAAPNAHVMQLAMPGQKTYFDIYEALSIVEPYKGIDRDSLNPFPISFHDISGHSVQICI
jgi:hypothetical protein